MREGDDVATVPESTDPAEDFRLRSEGEGEGVAESALEDERVTRLRGK